MPDSPERHLASDLATALIDLRRLTRSIGRSALNTTGISRTHYSLLVFCNEMGQARIADLADAIELDHSVVSRKVSNLEESGLLQREPDPADRRASLITLTDAGRQTIDRTRDVYAELLEASTQGWSAEEIRSVTAAINRLAGTHKSNHALPDHEDGR